jgi:hypothetical protein
VTGAIDVGDDYGAPVYLWTESKNRMNVDFSMGIPTTEEKAKRIGQTSGTLKKDAVLDLVQTELQLGQLVIGRDLSQDGEVMKAAGAIVDSVVTLHNIIAAKSGVKPA